LPGSCATLLPLADMARTAVVLMNLGGPDSLEAVEPFLYNLFADPAIISLPWMLRLPLARFIARRRAPVARRIFEHLGGRSPLYENTLCQARALEQELSDGARVFIAMRYAPPTTAEAVSAVLAFEPEEVVCLPLYPQFSKTTTGSSLTEWQREVKRQGLTVPTHWVFSYAEESGFIEAEALLIDEALDAVVGSGQSVRLLLTAHGLPERIARSGDPYPYEVEKTAASIADTLSRPHLDWRVCYQSEIGPLPWIGPPTREEIRRAGSEGLGVVVAPISFVSEHSETLVELDRDYRRLAEECGVPYYRRVPTVGTHPIFIRTLAALVKDARDGDVSGAAG
jgi:protoporphyrin/coproporphyrin ferrochelatase